MNKKDLQELFKEYNGCNFIIKTNEPNDSLQYKEYFGIKNYNNKSYSCKILNFSSNYLKIEYSDGDLGIKYVKCIDYKTILSVMFSVRSSSYSRLEENKIWMEGMPLLISEHAYNVLHD